MFKPKISSNVRCSPKCNSLQTVMFVMLDWIGQKTLYRHTRKSRQSTANDYYIKHQVSVIRVWSIVTLSHGGSLDTYCSLKPLWSGMESSASSYLADPSSPIPSHCAVINLFKSVPVHELS